MKEIYPNYEIKQMIIFFLFYQQNAHFIRIHTHIFIDAIESGTNDGAQMAYNLFKSKDLSKDKDELDNFLYEFFDVIIKNGREYCKRV